MKTAEELIRDKIVALYKENPIVHIDVSLSRPRLELKSAEAVIT